MRRYSTLAEVKEMQIKIKYNFTSDRKKLTSQITPSIGEDLGKQERLCIIGGNIDCWYFKGQNLAVSIR